MSPIRITIAAVAAGAVLLPTAALATVHNSPIPSIPALTAAHPTTDERAVEVALINHRVVDDSTYGPAAIYTLSVHNVGTQPTKTLNVTLPDGSVFLDREGEQALIHCLDNFMPLPPGDRATCEAYRLLTDSELVAGRTDPIELTVAAFGADGPTVGGLRAESLPTGELGRALSFALKDQQVADDSSYGPVENIEFQVTNTGRVPAGFELAVYNGAGESYLDEHGDVMRLYCTDGFFSDLPAGETLTCIAQRRLADSEIAAGVTEPQALQFTGWGRQSQKIEGFTTAAVTFDPAIFTVPGENTAPTPEEPAPTPENPAPTPEEPAPTPKDPAPTPEKPAPTPEDPAPTPEDPAPTPQQPAPDDPGSLAPTNAPLPPVSDGKGSDGRLTRSVAPSPKLQPALPVTGAPIGLLSVIAGALAASGAAVRSWTHRI